ncbi:MAG: vitamin K epoxide reductase family protein [Tropheryma whipplei]|nr:vitamin K epoxide reductase family protein [Tropheryma whipplei]
MGVALQKGAVRFIAITACGIVGVALSLLVTLEKIAVLGDPHHVPACSLSKLVNCLSVLDSPEASLFFGIPNSLIGLIGFSIVTSFGVFGIAFGTFPQWLWTCFTVGMLSATLFCIFLSYVSSFLIGAVCLYCVGVWVVSSLGFALGLSPTLHNTRFAILCGYGPLAFGSCIIYFASVLIFGVFL